jgi:hypothetical protein
MSDTAFVLPIISIRSWELIFWLKTGEEIAGPDEAAERRDHHHS